MIDTIEKLKVISSRDLQILYKNFFTSNEGQLILEDLKGRFWEYMSPSDLKEMGQQSVLIHIKNQINPPDDSIYEGQMEGAE